MRSWKHLWKRNDENKIIVIWSEEGNAFLEDPMIKANRGWQQTNYQLPFHTAQETKGHFGPPSLLSHYTAVWGRVRKLGVMGQAPSVMKDWFLIFILCRLSFVIPSLPTYQCLGGGVDGCFSLPTPTIRLGEIHVRFEVESCLCWVFILELMIFAQRNKIAKWSKVI